VVTPHPRADGAVRSERDRRSQRLPVDRAGATVEVEERLVDRDKIAHLRDEFDRTVRSLGLSHELCVPKTLSGLVERRIG
jgi:hypothetical protein